MTDEELAETFFRVCLFTDLVEKVFSQEWWMNYLKQLHKERREPPKEGT